jgi:hypothetical protein
MVLAAALPHIGRVTAAAIDANGYDDIFCGRLSCILKGRGIVFPTIVDLTPRRSPPANSNAFPASPAEKPRLKSARRLASRNETIDHYVLNIRLAQ